MKFSHLHNHTQYSLLDGASDIEKLYAKAREFDMPGIAITDHGNMFGVFNFFAESKKPKNLIKTGIDQNGKDIFIPKVKPIIGCEFYVVEDRTKKNFTNIAKDKRYHQLLLAKNEIGYKNLVKLNSLGFIEGYYNKYPRIDKELLQKYSHGLIATTCCIGGMVPQYILTKSELEAEKEFQWWLDIFGNDYYIELQRHGVSAADQNLKTFQDQTRINNVLINWSKKYNIPLIATNDSHYIEKKDAEIHDILLCVNTGGTKATPGEDDFTNDENFVKGKRFKFPNHEFYFKSSSEMLNIFSDLPEAIENTQIIVDKIELINLYKDILLPVFPIPNEFKLTPNDTENQFLYLKFLTEAGKKIRYPITTLDIEERIQYELDIIRKMKFSGYFLIVQDFIQAAKSKGVFVGLGRGSAGGSVIAYCLGITNIDPIKYKLLFERFLNPDRQEMPDIDTDFDEEGRQIVLDYVVEKYTKEQVAHIITYGGMASKSSIKDVGRVLEFSLNETNTLAKLVPLKTPSLNYLFNTPFDQHEELKNKTKQQPISDVSATTPATITTANLFNATELDNIKKLRTYFHDDKFKDLLQYAQEIEGSIRNTGVHASAVIIAPQNLTELMPISVAKNTHLYVTQIEGTSIEKAGVIKMDFLGLTTLSIIKKTLEIVKNIAGIDIDLDNLPLNDEKTFKLFQINDTLGVFQFEGSGMQNFLRQLKPDKIEDLIALNALFRPGPMKYIDSYIKRKFGQETVEYDLPEMKEFLEETYGITVYQEQVMLLSQKLAGFSRGDSDKLRKAMGKKDKDLMKIMKAKFQEGMNKNNFPEAISDKIWNDWSDFASYAFNKSHSTAYAILAYQTGYLKANFRAPFMASMLNYAKTTEKISTILDQCRLHNIIISGPDVNESEKGFTVNKNMHIRYGLGGIKGLGENTIDNILEDRNLNGPYKDLENLFERLNSKVINKKAIEALVYAGALDSITTLNRATIIYRENENSKANFEKLFDYVVHKNILIKDNQNSLFSETNMLDTLTKPELKICEPWKKIEQLNQEKLFTGMYFSGHPLDEWRFEFNHFKITPLSVFIKRKPLSDFEKNSAQNNKDTSTTDFDEDVNEAVTDIEPELPLYKEGDKVRIAGMVTKIEEKISKTNKIFFIVEIEDFKEKYNFSLRGEDVNTYKGLLNKENIGNFVFIDIIFESNYYSSQIDYKIKKFDLLKNLHHKISSIQISTQPSEINDDIIQKWSKKNHSNKKGSIVLKIEINDPLTNIRVKFISKDKISFDNGLKKILESHYQNQFKLNFNG